MKFLALLAILMPMHYAGSFAPATASTEILPDTEPKKRKRGLAPKPLHAPTTGKNRLQARAAAKRAQIFDTVDLIENSQNVNILHNFTIKPPTNTTGELNTSTVSNTSSRQDVGILPHITSDSELLLPCTQSVIETVFDDRETDDAIEALITTLEENQCRTMSPDIFQEAEDAYENDTFCFISEKIALMKTKIEMLEKDNKKLKSEEDGLLRRLNQIQSEHANHEKSLVKLKDNLEKFESFINVLS